MAYHFQFNEDDGEDNENQQHQRRTDDDDELSPSLGKKSRDEDPLNLSPRTPPWLKANERPPTLFGGGEGNAADDNAAAEHKDSDMSASPEDKEVEADGRNAQKVSSPEKAARLSGSGQKKSVGTSPPLRDATSPSSVTTPVLADAKGAAKGLRDWWNKWEHEDEGKGDIRSAKGKFRKTSTERIGENVPAQHKGDEQGLRHGDDDGSWLQERDRSATTESLRLPVTPTDSSDSEYHENSPEDDGDDCGL